MKFTLSTHNGRIAYSIEGKKSACPLVLLHGFCEDHTVWAPIQSLLKPEGFVQVDLPGFGASDIPVIADMEFYANAVLSVLEAEKIHTCVLVGHSLGGYVALEFASKWPNRLAGIGLIHSHPFEDPEDRKTARRRGIETLQSGKRDLYVAQLFPNLFAPDFLKKAPETLQKLIENGKKQPSEGIIAALQAMISRRDHQSTLSALNACPVLFLLGAQDTLVPLELGLKAALLPAVVDLHIQKASAHMAMFESSEETASILNSFWQFCQPIPTSK